MSTIINQVGSLHMAGRAGKRRWRVKYWLEGEPGYQTKYFGPAEGPKKLSRREANRLVARWQQSVGANPGQAIKITLPTLDEHVAHYLATAAQRCNEAVQALIQLSCKKFTDFVDGRRRLDQITPSHGDQFLGHLQAAGLADATIRTHIQNVKALMRQATKRFPDHLRINPFGHIRVQVKPAKGKWKYVPYADAVKAIEACPRRARTSTVGWQVLIALCRFAGLRFSEAMNLEKKDVDLTSEPPTIKVYSSKTARASRQSSRVVPVLFPILKDLLVRAIGESSPAERFVVASAVPRRRNDAHRTLKKVLERAKLVDEKGRTLWRPGFQVLRASCEKDFLGLGLSEYRYTRAIGHSPAVSRKYYLDKFEGAVLEDDARDEFRAAAARLTEQLAAST